MSPKQTKSIYSSEEALDVFVSHDGDGHGDNWLKKGKYNGVKENDVGPSPLRLTVKRLSGDVTHWLSSFRIYRDDGENESEITVDHDDFDPHSISEDEVYVEKTHHKRERDAQMQTYNLPTIPNISNELTGTKDGNSWVSL